MLAFFRRVRKSIFEDGSTKKYVLYAIGEIILVVIGILIAITLNNNNQNKVAKQERDEKVTKMRHDIYNDSISIMSIITYNRNNTFVIDSLLHQLNSEMSFENYERFVKRFARANMNFRTSIPDQSVYNELINSGSFSKIEDEDFKARISTFYLIYNHFNDLINRFLDPLLVTEKSIFSEGLLAHKYFRPEVSDANMQLGYIEFKTFFSEPVHRNIIENHLFELNGMHNQIISFYDTILNQIIKGLPMAPNEEN